MRCHCSLSDVVRALIALGQLDEDLVAKEIETQRGQAKRKLAAA